MKTAHTEATQIRILKMTTVFSKSSVLKHFVSTKGSLSS